MRHTLTSLCLSVALLQPALAAADVTAGSCLVLLPPPTDNLPPDAVELSADSMVLQEDGISKLSGTVMIRHENRVIESPEVNYDDRSKSITTGARMRYHDANFLVQSGPAEYQLDRNEGRFTDAQFAVTRAGGRGSAEEIRLLGSDQSDLRNARYTSCPEGSNAWELGAGRIHLDQEEGLGSVRNATLRLGGIPVFYFPYFQFPTDERRRTGLLYPSFGSNTQVGFDFRQPVYLNLAPNYDAVITPRLMTDRGLQLAADARYLLERGTGSVRLETLPSDAQTGTARNLALWNHRQLLSNRLGWEVDATQASDPRYFEDLAQRRDQAAQPQLAQNARLTYEAAGLYTLTALFSRYQLLSNALPGTLEPYRRLPEMRLDAVGANSLNGWRLGGSAMATYFTRANSVEGLREVIAPYVRYEGGFGAVDVTSQVDYVLRAYQLQNTLPGQNAAPRRAQPIASVDLSLPLARATQDATELLTPRLFYLYSPFQNQDALPVFDSAEPNYDITRLFARNRFTGQDRIADANDLIAAVTYRRLNARGDVAATATFGHRYRFASSRLASGNNSTAAGSAEYLAEVGLKLSETLNLVGALNAQPSADAINIAAVQLQYRDASARRASVGYRFRRGLLEQADLSFVSPVFGAWSLAGRLRESLRDDRPLDALLGVQYDSCCYAVRAAYRRFLVNSQGDYSSGAFLQLELKGLTRIGTTVDEFLPEDEARFGEL